MQRPLALDLAHRQLERDRLATARFPHLLQHKLRRMAVSPLSYLRGAAPLFYELLATHRELAEGPLGKGWLVGDAHLENFGAYRVRAGAPASDSETDVTFDLNDFDEAFEGPWRLDVLRLVTSVILGGRELGSDGTRSVRLAHALLDAYRDFAFDSATLPEPPRPIAALLEQVQTRSARDLLDGRTRLVHGRRRFEHEDGRYLPLSPHQRNAAARAFTRYVAKLDEHERPSEAHCAIVDLAFRVAGTGSLGGTRIAVLARGKGGAHTGWVFDMKEQRAPAAALLRGRKAAAGQCLTALLACLAQPPRMLGETTLEGRPMLVRRLAPQEDKLDLTRIERRDLEPVTRYLGALLGRAHRRAASKSPKRSWSKADASELIERAIVVAGVHEAAYLAMCNAM